MNKEQAKQLIKDTFESSFDEEKFIFFIKNLLNEIDEDAFKYSGSYIKESFRERIKSFERLGKYFDPDGKRIDILIVYLKKNTSINARTTLRNFIAGYLQGKYGRTSIKDAALVAFVSPDRADWRFSLVKMDYRPEVKPDGKVKIKEEFTPARRWSFLVGKNEKSHTAQSRLVNILADDKNNPTLKELEEAFNVEPVTKEFFEKYRELFIRTVDELDKIVKKNEKVRQDFEKNNINTVDFAKKLLGQIVFLYFLQKKGWFGVKRDADWGSGPRNFLRELYEGKHGKYENFFNDILEPLFYEALARERDDDFYSRFNCKIPFLNGGLFEPIGGYNWVHTDIKLPNKLFSNNRRTPEGDIGDGILDVFDRFNFTVKEDEPLEKEVAIDPELLGKLYEKFNAIRPDNFYEYKKALAERKRSLEKQFNKKYGVYYTPREIVHYMCQQSLIYYLYTEVNQELKKRLIPADKQRGLAGFQKTEKLKMPLDEEPIKKEDIETFIKYGEFFIEHEETVEKKEKETKDYKYILPASIRKYAKVIDEKLRNIKVCDPAVGSGAFLVGMMSEIVKARTVLSSYIKEPGRTLYNFKRECIENSLYGVDIDSGAVEIAKLRLWLSLVVDEEDIRQIKPLPNLDYKIVCGNSLLGVEKNLFNNQLFRELERLKPLYFNETNPRKKKEYRQQIEELIEKITGGHKEFDFEVYFSEVFHEKGGFDIVIANPPYVFTRKMGFSDSFKKYVKDKFFNELNSISTGRARQAGKINLFALFILRAVKLTREYGLISYIVPNTILRTTTYDIIRKYILDQTKILQIIDLGGGVFDAVTAATIILILQKGSSATNELMAILNIENMELSKFDINIIQQKKFYSNVSYSFNIFVDSQIYYLLEKIDEQGKYLGDLCIDIIEGIVAHKNLITSENVENSFPLLEGKNIRRYYILPPKKKIIWNTKKIHRARSQYIWQANQKIVIQRISGGNMPLVAALDTQKYKTFASVNNLLLKNNYESYYKFILALLNSRLLNFYYANNFSNRSKLTVNVSKTYLEKLPICFDKVQFINEINVFVEKILSLTQSEDYLENPEKQAKVKEYERQIDQLVYELYGLTEEEIKIVEGAFSDEI